MYCIRGTAGQHYLGDVTTSGGFTTTFMENTAMKFETSQHAMMHLLGCRELMLKHGSTTAWIFRSEVVPCSSAV